MGFNLVSKYTFYPAPRQKFPIDEKKSLGIFINGKNLHRYNNMSDSIIANLVNVLSVMQAALSNEGFSESSFDIKEERGSVTAST
jgi:hypothetical protein